MDVKPHKKQRSVVFHWLFSYILIFSIPLFVFVGMSLKYVRILTEELDYSNRLTISHVQNKMDSVLKQINSLADEAQASLRIRNLSTASHVADIGNYELYQTMEDLNKLNRVRDDIQDFFIFFKDLDFIVSDKTYSRSMDYYETFLKRSSLGYELWESLLMDNYAYMQIFPISFQSLAGNQDRLVIIRPLSYTLAGQQQANMVIILDPTVLEIQENNVLERTRQNIVLISDEGNNILYSSHKKMYEAEEGVRFMRSVESGKQQVTALGRDMMVASRNSGISRLIYYVLVDKEQFFSQLMQIQRLAIFFIFVVVFGGGILIYFIIRKNYLSLSSVMKSLDDHPVPFDKRRMNEYSIISSAIHTLRDEKKSIGEIVEHQKGLLQTQLIYSLVTNSKTTGFQLDLRLMEDNGISFASGLFAVLVVALKPQGRKRIAVEDSYYEALAQRIQTIFSERQVRTFYFREADSAGFIINPKEMETDALYAWIREVLKIIREEMPPEFNLLLSAGCSDTVRTYLSLPLAYQQAQDVWEFNTSISQDEIVFFHEMECTGSCASYLYPLESELALTSALKNGDIHEALTVIDGVRQLNYDAKATPCMVRALYMSISGTILKSYSRMNSQIINPHPLASLNDLFTYKNTTEAYEALKKAVEHICRLQEEMNHSSFSAQDRSIYNLTLEYIAKNYHDKNLSVNSIADEFNVSLVYLSRLFSKYHTSCLSDYINYVRIQHAKEYLVMGKTAQTISDLVGFGSLRTFMRVFKKIEEITPGQFKELQGDRVVGREEL